MGHSHNVRRESLSGHMSVARPDYHVDVYENDLVWPFNKLDGIDRDDIRATAYEIFFTACRSSPGFGGRNALAFYSSSNLDNSDGTSSPKPKGVVMTPTGRIKRALGLKMLKRSPSRRMSTGGNCGSNPPSPSSHGNSGASPGLSNTLPSMRPRRPMTSAEIMRQQMKVTEQSDNRLRKTLMRTLVGQVGRRAETIILPLELLRHLKPSEFTDVNEYHFWQRRQLKILEAGLLLHPSIPLDKSNTFAMRLREIIRASESKPIDTGKNSDTMRTLCNSVVSLSWRSVNGTPTDVCHWADGFPLNIHIYVSLLQTIFDIRDETSVLDEVDELLELMKKTWSTLGITRPIHNVCFAWALFEQYVVTAQLEPDLLCAAHTMLAEVANDAKKPDREAMYVKLLTSVLTSMQTWAEKRLLHYHDYFQRGTVGQVENLLPLALSASKILGEDVTITEGAGQDRGDVLVVDSSGDRVDYYIRCSVRNAFGKVLENGKIKEAKGEGSEALLQLAKETEDLALKERECFSPILKKWHPTAVGVAAVTLHNCYGSMLKKYLGGVTMLTSETIGVFHRAGRLEKVLVQMVVEDSADCEDGGKAIVREMVPFEVDSIILNLLKSWVDERLKKQRDCLSRSKESETWNPRSKTEPYAQSAVELMKLAKETVEEFFEIPIGVTEELVREIAAGLEHSFQDYITFVSSCGSKQSYIPQLPPLTRCNRDSKFAKLWKRATPCSVVGEETTHHLGSQEGNQTRASTSRGTQRLYIRLNTLHYMLSHLHSLNKILSLSPKVTASTGLRFNSSKSYRNSSYFELSNRSIESACQHVSEVAAFRLIFLDSSSVFYDTLYTNDVANARIQPGLRVLKQNLTLLCAIVTDRAQALAMKEVMRASFEAFLMVLLAGGSSRVFYRSDHEMIDEDFGYLKKIFCDCGEGFLQENIVEREAEAVGGVIALMSQGTEQLVEDFSIVTCETSGIGVMGSGQKLPMPPTTGRWNRADPNTILRVLCHRNDRAANLFLKKTFQLAKRR
ncbi:hypothetical protein SDJN02_20681, partial [Cucurbita argyrosperma subsp. argyrosperma]|uniref:Uncharacterized protein LOC111431932 isoform X1 n=1 Tax=Cucurbita moschata TaxID=3662 RepID=A0A6J1E9F0_CUCMO